MLFWSLFNNLKREENNRTTINYGQTNYRKNYMNMKITDMPHALILITQLFS